MTGSKYDWWKCSRCGGRFLINEPMHGCYQGATEGAHFSARQCEYALGVCTRQGCADQCQAKAIASAIRNKE